MPGSLMKWVLHPGGEWAPQAQGQYIHSNGTSPDNESAKCTEGWFHLLWGRLVFPPHHFSRLQSGRMFSFPILKKYHSGSGWNIALSLMRKMETNKMECDILQETSAHPAKYWKPEISSPGWEETQGLTLWKQYRNLSAHFQPGSLTPEVDQG